MSNITSSRGNDDLSIKEQVRLFYDINSSKSSSELSEVDRPRKRKNMHLLLQDGIDFD